MLGTTVNSFFSSYQLGCPQSNAILDSKRTATKVSEPLHRCSSVKDRAHERHQLTRLSLT